MYWTYPPAYTTNPNENEHENRLQRPNYSNIELKDYGGHPFVVNINKATKQNRSFRTALWTGDHLQVTLMSINVGEDIGLEVHPTVDQFLRIEEGQGIVQMGDTKDNLYFERRVYDDDAIMVPAGKWHNIINTGNKPLKLYSIYAPPEHPFGTVHETKADAMAAEGNDDY
jgi:mannose-6-phosphate isomerase-like protein (cupin superfamily)